MSESAAFSSLFLDVLDRIKTPAQTQREADYLLSLFELPRSAHLLDVPCGNGRIGAYLAEQGYTITGVDTGGIALDRARATIAARDLGARFTVQARDMRDLPWADEFDAAYCFWESFGYFDDAGNRALLAAVAHALKPGGKFVFDTQITETLLPRMALEHWEMVGDDIIVMEARSYDHKTATALREFVFVKDGQVERAKLPIRLYTYRELIELVLAAGFRAVEDYSWLSLMPFTLNSSRLILMATK